MDPDLDGWARVGQNLKQSFSSAETDQDGLDAAIDSTVQVTIPRFSMTGTALVFPSPISMICAGLV